jgi:hypothetical protein
MKGIIPPLNNNAKTVLTVNGLISLGGLLVECMNLFARYKPANISIIDRKSNG